MAQLELLGAVAREDEMGMRIDEAGQDGAPTGIVATLRRHASMVNLPAASAASGPTQTMRPP